ncbi:MAG: DUF4388 domain-containing protein [Elainellaceae cyanobacterium]
MAITGHLVEFSLAEIFQFLEQGHKTGLLTIFEQPEPAPPRGREHYIWFNQGRVVAAANRSDHRGLISSLSQRGLLGDRAASRLAQSCGPKVPLGLYLKSQGILDAEQLKLLFYTQVMRQVCALFSVVDGWFHFDSKAVLPCDEMTGLSAPATEVTLAGLRALRNWSMLEDKLPDPMSTIVALVEGQPSLRLNAVEWQVWEFTGGKDSLQTIAQHLQLPIHKVQEIVFRLNVVGLLEEVPMMAIEAEATQQHEEEDEQQAPSTLPDAAVSQSFLNNLVSFLKHKV